MTFAMYTSARERPIPPRSWSSSLPAWPTNGKPCLSSWKPGASPTNIRSASGLPSKTTCVPSLGETAARAVRDLGRVSVELSARSHSSRRNTASGGHRPAVARLLGGAVSREHGELLAHVRGLAVGAAHRFPVPDELLEVRLALHAHVLVDRHRRGSLGRGPSRRNRSSGPAGNRPWKAMKGHSARLDFRCPVSATELELSCGRENSDRRHGPRGLGGGRQAVRGSAADATRRARPALRARPRDRRGRPGDRAGPWIAHTSGATPLAALDPHERRFGLHPLQTFTRARGPEQLDGAYAAVTAESRRGARGRLLARRELGLEPFALDDSQRRALPRRSRRRVELPRHAAQRRGGPLRGRRRAARSARSPLMRRVIENDFELTGPDRARRLGDRRGPPRGDPRARARARAALPRARRRDRGAGGPMKIVRTIAAVREGTRPRGRSGSSRRWAPSTRGTSRCSRPRARRTTSSSRASSSTRRSSGRARTSTATRATRSATRRSPRRPASTSSSPVGRRDVPGASRPGSTSGELGEKLEGEFRPATSAASRPSASSSSTSSARPRLLRPEGRAAGRGRQAARPRPQPRASRSASCRPCATTTASRSPRGTPTSRRRNASGARASARARDEGSARRAERCATLDVDVDYVEVADFDGQRVLAAAVRVGNTRLIDNVVLEGEPK